TASRNTRRYTHADYNASEGRTRADGSATVDYSYAILSSGDRRPSDPPPMPRARTAPPRKGGVGSHRDAELPCGADIRWLQAPAFLPRNNRRCRGATGLGLCRDRTVSRFATAELFELRLPR